MDRVSDLKLCQESGKLSRDEYAKLKDIKEELDKIVVQEECHRRQRSRVQCCEKETPT